MWTGVWGPKGRLPGVPTPPPLALLERRPCVAGEEAQEPVGGLGCRATGTPQREAGGLREEAG